MIINDTGYATPPKSKKGRAEFSSDFTVFVGAALWGRLTKDATPEVRHG